MGEKVIKTKEEFEAYFEKIALEIREKLKQKYNLEFFWTGRLFTQKTNNGEVYLPEMALNYNESDLE
jgi:hypothetical protein